MRNRYEAVGNWRGHKNLFIFIHPRAAVFIYIADCRDKQTGKIYPDGAYRVTVEGPKGHPRSRTFYGESAWCNADNYAEDATRWLEADLTNNNTLKGGET